MEELFKSNRAIEEWDQKKKNKWELFAHLEKC